VRHEDLAKTILEYVRRQVPVGGAQIGFDTPLLDGTLDSLALIRLMAFVKSAYGIEIKHVDVTPFNFGSTSALGRFIESRIRTISSASASER
jgi:acyl carrier protein